MSEPAAWNEGLESIEPLVEYYAREMGQLAGRLIVALSLLVDLEDSYGWKRQAAQTRDMVRCSRLLVAFVLRILAVGQAKQEDEMGMARALDKALRHRPAGPRP